MASAKWTFRDHNLEDKRFILKIPDFHGQILFYSRKSDRNVYHASWNRMYLHFLMKRFNIKDVCLSVHLRMLKTIQKLKIPSHIKKNFKLKVKKYNPSSCQEPTFLRYPWKKPIGYDSSMQSSAADCHLSTYHI